MAIFWSLIVVFIFQGSDSYYNRARLFRYLARRLDGQRRRYLVTYQFMHAGVMHILFNLFALFFFGKALEDTLGTRKFLQAYFGSGIAGGLMQVIITAALYPKAYAHHDTVGASAGIMGIIAVFAMINPYQAINIWGIFPIRAMWFLVATALISFYFTIVPVGGVAHAAHLGGLLFGVAYAKWFMHADWSAFTAKFRRTTPKPRELVTTPAGAFWKKPGKPMPPEEDIPSGDFISKEVDPILDKISAHGIQSLTERERRILEAARAKMSKR